MSKLDELLAIVDSLAFEEYGRMDVASAHWSQRGVTIRMKLEHGDGNRSAWELRFGETLEYSLGNVFFCGLNIHRDDHPAIRQYVDKYESLHFSSPARNANEAVGELLAAHRELADDWIPFDRYIRCSAELLRMPSGLIAKGPAFLIERYAQVLDAQGCGMTRQRIPRARAVENALMAHFGESFVVAETLRVTRRS